MAINRSSKIPYYQQLYEILRGKIDQGQWQPGDLLPPESELITTYQLSRNTVREVMDMLVNEGFIYRERGRGTFVAQPKMEQALVRIINFTQDMHQRGLSPSSRILEATLVPAPADIAAALRVPDGTELGLLKRLRLGNEEPMSVEEAYFIHKRCPGFLKRHDYTRTSLREALEQDYGLRWLRAKQIIRAITAPKDIAPLLEVTSRAPLLMIERVTYAEDDRPTEFLRAYYRGDRYSLYNELNG